MYQFGEFSVNRSNRGDQGSPFFSSPFSLPPSNKKKIQFLDATFRRLYAGKLDEACEGKLKREGGPSDEKKRLERRETLGH